MKFEHLDLALEEASHLDEQRKQRAAIPQAEAILIRLACKGESLCHRTLTRDDPEFVPLLALANHANARDISATVARLGAIGIEAVEDAAPRAEGDTGDGIALAAFDLVFAMLSSGRLYLRPGEGRGEVEIVFAAHDGQWRAFALPPLTKRAWALKIAEAIAQEEA